MKEIIFVLGTPNRWSQNIEYTDNIDPKHINYEFFIPKYHGDMNSSSEDFANPLESDFFKKNVVWNPFKELIFEVSGLMSSRHLFNEFENLISTNKVSPEFQNTYPLIFEVLSLIFTLISVKIK